MWHTALKPYILNTVCIFPLSYAWNKFLTFQNKRALKKKFGIVNRRIKTFLVWHTALKPYILNTVCFFPLLCAWNKFLTFQNRRALKKKFGIVNRRSKTFLGKRSSHALCQRILKSNEKSRKNKFKETKSKN